MGTAQGTQQQSGNNIQQVLSNMRSLFCNLRHYLRSVVQNRKQVKERGLELEWGLAEKVSLLEVET